MRRVQKAGTRIAREADCRPELQRMSLLGPGKIIQQIVQWHLEIVAVRDALIQAEKRVPWLVGIAHHSEALPRESPVKGIGETWAEDCGVADDKAFAVVNRRLLRSIAWQKGSSWVPQIL